MVDFEPNLRGWRPEPPEITAKHWSFDLVRDCAAPVQSSDMRWASVNRHAQWNTSSCVAQAVVKALEVRRCIRLGVGAHRDLSRLAIYYLAREIMRPPEVDKDDGTFIAWACEALARFGTCEESLWPFEPAKVFEAPTWRAMRHSYKNRITAYYRLTTGGDKLVEDVKRALAQSLPVVYGTTVGPEWKAYDGTGVLGLPSKVLGRHATVLLGWDEARGCFIGENSWGYEWGDKGFYYLAPEVVANFSSRDFTVMTGSVT